MHSLIGIYLTAIVVIICLAVYLLPAIIAIVWHAPDTMVVIVLNVLTGWTFIGWVVCLALALRKHNPSVQVINQVHVPHGRHSDNGDRAA